MQTDQNRDDEAAGALRESQKKAEELGLQDSDVLKEVNKELDKLAGKERTDRKDAD